MASVGSNAFTHPLGAFQTRRPGRATIITKRDAARSVKPIAIRELHHGPGPGAAVAADVRLVCPMVNRAELAGNRALVPGDRPGGARHGPQVAAVRPAEHHPEIHPGHVALAAAHVLRAGILGATVGALLVILDDGDPAEASVEAGADVDVSSRAVVAAAQK